MPYRLSGKCNHCGICCIELVDVRMRVGDEYSNPCRYLVEKDDKRYCQIRLWEEEGDSESFSKIPLFDLEYYMKECKPYPDPKDEAHWDESRPKSCGYTRVEE